MNIEGTIKKIIAIIISIMILLQCIPSEILLADEETGEYLSQGSGINEVQENLEYSNQTTDEVLKLIEKGINIDKFFSPDLVKGITKEDLLEWKEKGLDIRDVVSDRAKNESSVIDYGYFSENITKKQQNALMATAIPNNGKYYLTECSNPEDKGNVNLAGTGYDNELYNPKTGDKGITTPWYISLAGDTAMCVTYEGNASISTAHSYIQSDVNKIKSNKYFAGGSNYPVEGYLKGVCFAYEKLIDAGNGNTFYTIGSIDSNLSELVRQAGSAELVARAGKSINYAVMQIITWRIACGKFNPDNMAYESALAKVIFEQMYPIDEWGNVYYKSIEAFYEYYAKCAKESASGNYNNVYGKTQLIYWEVQGSDTDNWQDFITWNVGKPDIKQVTVTKYGNTTGVVEENAVYGIYSDKSCINKLKEFTTDANGSFRISAIEGVYYVKELKAPTGTVLSSIITELIVKDDTTDISVKNDEIYNKLEFCKYEYGTGEKVNVQAEYALYEYDNAHKSYVKSGQMYYEGEGKYTLNNSQVYTYHEANGNKKSIHTDKIYYTPNNLGKFMIREEKPPKGFSKSKDKYFVMKMTNGAMVSFNTLENGIVETPNYASVELKKNDYFTGAELSDACFMIQEKIGGEWYDVGSLCEKKEGNSGTYNESSVYVTSKDNKYVFHNENGEISSTVFGSDYPLHYTTYNNGQYRLIETKLPDERYSVKWTRVFYVKPEENNYKYEFTSFGRNSAVNYGKSVKVKTLKYDSTTGEAVESNDTSAIISLYEYIQSINQWMKMGDLKYNDDTGEYTMNENMQYKLHKENGDEIRTSVNGIYLPGYIYYTSANKGRFKIVESVSPDNYEIGKYDNNQGTIVAYEQEFKIAAENKDKDIIDLTSLEKGAVDTGISANVNLTKYDSLTKDKINDSGAVFKVYEYNTKNNKWLEAGILNYDSKNKVYSSIGMEVQYHKSNGNETDNKEVCITGLKYTNANKGKYKIKEIIPPQYYKNSGYEKEIDITETIPDNRIINLDTYSEGAVDIGIGGYVSVAKYDSVTKEKVKSENAVFAIYERNNDDWLRTGELVYNKDIDGYSTYGGHYEFHDRNGNIIDNKDIKDFEEGKLYYTSVNKGRYKVVEEQAPDNYIINKYVKEFEISYDNQSLSFTSAEEGASDEGISIPVKLVKYDSITSKPVENKDGKFQIQEYIAAVNKWLNVGYLIYNESEDVYTTVGMEESIYHDSSSNEVKRIKTDGIIYTTANEGRFRVTEVVEPSDYIIGTIPYSKEFNICHMENGEVIDLTSREHGPANIGVSGTVKVAKYDSVTKEKVMSDNAEFTVYEYSYSLDKWLESGVLIYSDEGDEYVCDGVNFLFHDDKGNVLETDGIIDYQSGRLYHTTSNKGRFKVAETKAPTNYLLDGYEKEFTITESDMNIDFTDIEESVYNYGINGEVKLVKSDSIDGTPLSGAVFALKEWSKKNNDWVSKDILKDMGDGTYTTDKLVFTTQNEGRFIISETKAPEGYMNDEYESIELLLNEDNRYFDLTNEGKATDTPIRISVSKKSITTGKDIAGAELIVKNEAGDVIDEWISDGKEHIISGIRKGKYTLEEKVAPEGYVKSRRIEFEVKSSYDIQKVEMYDEVVKGRIFIEKMDKDTKEKLSGAVFELRTKEGDLVQKVITNQEGIAEIDNIYFGIYDENGKYLNSVKYVLTEVQAPEGYRCNNEPVEITFQNDNMDMDTGTVEVRKNIYNEREPEVPTGDIADYRIIIAGIFAAVILVLIKIRAII